MLVKQLGNTEIKIPAIGQGTGDFFWNSDIDFKLKVNLLQKGIDCGMNLIDTAEGYGDGLSEEIVAQAIKGIRDRVIISTKFSPEHNGYNDIMRSVETSLGRLQTDYIDIYQVHWTNPKIPLLETMNALQHLLDAGKIRAIGVCNFSQGEIFQANHFLGAATISSLQIEYNLFERTIEESGALSYCEQNGISIFAYSPLDQGRISTMNRNQLSLLSSISQKYGRTVAQIILRWLVSKHSIVAITRTTKENHIFENAAAMDFDLSIEEVNQIGKAFVFNILHISTDKIRISTEGEWNHKIYQTVEDAIENKYGFIPSPIDLAKAIKEGEFLKPVRVIPSTHRDYDYDLIAGRIRFWAWVIAHEGKLPIPCYVRQGTKSKKQVEECIK